MGQEEAKADMSEKFLSQEEIDMLLKGSVKGAVSSEDGQETKQKVAQKTDRETGGRAFEETYEEAEQEIVPAEKEIDLARILDFPLRLSVRLGETCKTVGDLSSLHAGAVIELERGLSEPVDMLVNGKLIAKGEVVVIEEDFGIRITQILSHKDRIRELGKQ